MQLIVDVVGNNPCDMIELFTHYLCDLVCGRDTSTLRTEGRTNG